MNLSPASLRVSILFELIYIRTNFTSSAFLLSRPIPCALFYAALQDISRRSRMLRLSVSSISTFYLLCLLSVVGAQSPFAFRWKLNNPVSRLTQDGYQSSNSFLQSSTQSLQECQKLQVALEPLDSSNANNLGISPYYMLAFEVGGIPTTSVIGSDPADLWWQASHKRGTKKLPNNISYFAVTLYSRVGSDARGR